MAFREQLTSCPRCHLLIAIDSIMVDERATVRIVGRCTNPNCHTQSICRDLDPLQIAAYEASIIKSLPEAKVSASHRQSAKAPGH